MSRTRVWSRRMSFGSLEGHFFAQCFCVLARVMHLWRSQLEKLLLTRSKSGVALQHHGMSVGCCWLLSVSWKTHSFVIRLRDQNHYELLYYLPGYCMWLDTNLLPFEREGQETCVGHAANHERKEAQSPCNIHEASCSAQIHTKHTEISQRTRNK